MARGRDLRARWLLVEGHRLDADASFRQGFRGYGDFLDRRDPDRRLLADIRNGTGRYSLTFLAI